MEMEERLHKYMARCGVASRRKCEELIAMGLVEVNGAVAREPGIRIRPNLDRVKVDGKKLRMERPAYYLHHKAKGVTTTASDDLGRKTVMDCLPALPGRVYPVGRLDKDSEGLLILTNDGPLAYHLTHPSRGVTKTYRVTIEGRIEESILRELAEKGLRLGPALVRPSRAELLRYDNENSIVMVTVAEGVNREVRRIFAALGHEVKRLLRTQVGPLTLLGLKRGATRALTPGELALLKKDMGRLEMPPAPENAFGRSRAGSGREKTFRRTRPAPRTGKPDPALAAAGSGKRGGKGGVVLDDWRKSSGSKRMGAARPGRRRTPSGTSPGPAAAPKRHAAAKKSGGGKLPLQPALAAHPLGRGGNRHG
ncbi:MAG: rRNA pseudouridine synthase [Planctomycetota bacterium]|jgi:23S rRNA pseudouridine2605 synthase|nr:rRNA pseudouridine synthase [Planctomycetota bacterium]